MATAKPYYDVGFWEHVYEREQKSFNVLLLSKAERLKSLKAKDLFVLPEPEARQTQRAINALTIELNTLYGFKLFTDEMRNCYMDNIEKTCGDSLGRILFLERELHLLALEYGLLLESFTESTNDCIFWIERYMKAIKQSKENE